MLLRVQGMSCGHCVAAIRTAVAPLPGVSDIDIDLTSGVVTVRGTADERAVAAAIEGCGYDIDRAA
jgi:copper chaperone CopZ